MRRAASSEKSGPFARYVSSIGTIIAMIDSIEDVRIFRQVVASGGFSAAARALRSTKNRVSQRVAALERAVGVSLARRTTRSLHLTEDGERFYLASEALVASAASLEASILRGGEPSGRVRVAVRSALSGVGMGDALARLLRAAPGLSLELAIIDDDIDLRSLDARGFDFAVQPGKVTDPLLVARKVGEVSFALCATPSYLGERGRPRTPGDLVRHECLRTLGASTESSWKLMRRDGRRVDAALGGRFECSDARLQSEVLFAGFGIGLRPLVEVKRLAHSGEVEHVLPGWSLLPIPVWLVAPKGRLRVPRVAKVAEVVEQVVASLA